MEAFILISVVVIVTFIVVYLLLSVGNLEKEVEQIKSEGWDEIDKRIKAANDLFFMSCKDLSKDVGNLSLTFEDTRHKFEKGWELAGKMAADIDNDFVSIVEEKTRKDWDAAADKATDRIVKYIADTIGNKDIEPERAEWLIRRYVRTVVGEISK